MASPTAGPLGTSIIDTFDGDALSGWTARPRISSETSTAPPAVAGGEALPGDDDGLFYEATRDDLEVSPPCEVWVVVGTMGREYLRLYLLLSNLGIDSNLDGYGALIDYSGSGTHTATLERADDDNFTALDDDGVAVASGDGLAVVHTGTHVQLQWWDSDGDEEWVVVAEGADTTYNAGFLGFGLAVDPGGSPILSLAAIGGGGEEAEPPVAVPWSASMEGGDLSEWQGSSASADDDVIEASDERAKTGGWALHAVGGVEPGFARAWTPVNWANGTDVWYGAWLWLPAADMTPYAALIRWDNAATQENGDIGGLVLDDQLRLYRQDYDGTNYSELDIPRADCPEGRWFAVDIRQKFSAVDGEAINELWIDGKRVGVSTVANSRGRGINHLRFGLVAHEGGGEVFIDDPYIALARRPYAGPRTGSVMTARADELPQLSGRLIH